MKIKSILCVLFLFGCTERRDPMAQDNRSNRLPSTSYEIAVVNNSGTDIYLTLEYGELKEDLGVVAKGSASREGFVPFSIGWVIAVTWSEGDRDADKKTSKLTTDQYLGNKDRIKSIELRYQPNREWSAVAYDAVGLRQNKVEPDPIGKGIPQASSTPTSTNAVSNVTTNK